MKKSRFTEEKMIEILKQLEAGRKVSELSPSVYSAERRLEQCASMKRSVSTLLLGTTPPTWLLLSEKSEADVTEKMKF